MNENIFLIGFMGSGKSHWGHIWALQHALAFYDLDTEIEEIFEKHGEEKFREIERYHLRKFDITKPYLLSCGGGTPCFFDNLDWMKRHGTIIYLKASPEYILDRVMEETSKRPLLKEREPVYLHADHVLEVANLTNDSLNLLKNREEKT